VHDEDEKSFSLVDSTRVKAVGARGGASARGRTVRAPAPRGGVGAARGRANAAPSRGGARGGRGGARGGYGYDKPQRTRDWSVTINPEWQVLEEIEFNRLNKLSLGVGEAETLSQYGTLKGYDRATFDRINTRNEKPLEIVDRVRYNITTSEDPVLTQLAEKKEGKIFATDSILSVLMCAPRSVNSWDIVIERRGDQVFFDKREGGAFDFLTVNENAFEPPADNDDVNSASSLSLEATYINQNFASQVILEKSKAYSPNPNPFYSPEETDPLAPTLYRYRKFDLSIDDDEELDLIVRTEVDAYLGKKDTPITVKALNEYDVKAVANSKALDWRKNLDTQKGAIVANEMKNNSAKLGRWAIQSYLAGAEQMKMGYISRINPRDAQRHSIVGVQAVKPVEFARQMNVSLANGWGIVRTIADLALKQPEGKYVLVKDPNNVSRGCIMSYIMSRILLTLLAHRSSLRRPRRRVRCRGGGGARHPRAGSVDLG
jgi:translation initiation factor 3 subunit D